MYGGIKKTECSICKNLVSNNNIKRHEISCHNETKNPNNPVKKIRGIDFDPNHGFKDGGRVPWNKGLTKYTSKIIEDQANEYSRKIKNGELQRRHRLYTDEMRKDQSDRAKKQGLGGYRANAGRSKKFKVEDSFGTIVTLQSSYEFECSKILNDLGIKWRRPPCLYYGGRRYYPDFYLVDFDIYLDPKNSYKAILDEEKIRQVRMENEVTLYVVYKNQLTPDWFKELLKI